MGGRYGVGGMNYDHPVEYIEEVCGLYFRSILLEKAGDRVPQHSHDHDHATFVGQGSVLAMADGEPIGYFAAGRAVPIKAGAVHEFEAQEDNTRLTCVHSIESAESIKRKGL